MPNPGFRIPDSGFRIRGGLARPSPAAIGVAAGAVFE
jgi:hypothetical protein